MLDASNDRPIVLNRTDDAEGCWARTHEPRALRGSKGSTMCQEVNCFEKGRLACAIRADDPCPLRIQL